LADIAGGRWPGLARQAALALSAHSTETSPITCLFLDINILFIESGSGRLFTRDLVQALNLRLNRPWAEMTRGKPITDLWLAQQLRDYGIAPKTIWIAQAHAKGYLEQDFSEVFRRYVTKSDLQDLHRRPPSARTGTTAATRPRDQAERRTGLCDRRQRSPARPTAENRPPR
jgi:hypothetical protein